MDNDFNLDQSDWIPRVAAWTIDCMNILKCTPYARKRYKCCVDNRIVRCCPSFVNAKDIKVYDHNGCQIDNLKNHDIHFTDSGYDNNFDLVQNCQGKNTSPFEKEHWNADEIAIFTGNRDVQERLKIGRICHDHRHNFVVIDTDKLELNYDTDWVVVEALCIATYYDEYFNEEVPYIYDNALLLDAICWYVMMKILQRGYKHPVFSLSGNEPVNPYIQFHKIKDQATAAVRHDLRDITKNEGWNNFFYNATFLPRR